MEKEPATVSRLGPTDAALVEASRAGEAWATEALYRRYIDMVYSLAYRLIGRDADLDDIVQDAFIECLRSLDRLAAPQAFAAWLKQIVVRTAQRTLRRRRMLDRLGLRWLAPVDPDELGTVAGSPAVIAEWRRLQAVMHGFPTEVRLVFLLHRVEGMQLQEIADVMKLSLRTTRRRLSEADRRLQAYTQPFAVSERGGKA